MAICSVFFFYPAHSAIASAKIEFVSKKFLRASEKKKAEGKETTEGSNSAKVTERRRDRERDRETESERQRQGKSERLRDGKTETQN